MNAQETLERLRKRYDVTLPSGLDVTIRLPRLRDCIRAGNVPMPVMQYLSEQAEKVEANGQAPDFTDEQMEHLARFQDEVVRQTLVAIDGEPVEMTHEAVVELEQDDYDALAAYAMRTTPVPTTAVSPA